MMQEEMLQAVRDRDANRVAELLAREPGLLHMKTSAGSLILSAVYSGAQSVVEVLLAAGPELNIFEAAATGSADRIRERLDADPTLANAANQDGYDPLGLAAFFGHPAAVAALLEGGADVNALSESKVSYVPSNTALHAALAGKRNLEVVERLLAAGADLSLRDSNGQTPLAVALHRGDPVFIELLRRHGATS